MLFSTVAASVLALASSAAAMPSEYNPFSTRSNCRNGPHTRDCWGNGWDIYCDYDQNWPATGRVVKYDLHLTTGTGGVAGSKAPLDGHQREMLLVNGQYPGPKIEANWGDTLEITVHNDLTSAWDNGTSIHWHGFRQYHTNTQDGTNGLTECPIAPGTSRTYKFVATAYGTSWYHSHYSIQYADGVVGPMVIHGPTSANYDYDLGPILLTDWFYEEAFELYEQAKVAPGPPTSDTVLVNGKMVSKDGGAYSVTTLTPGKKHLVRFVNTGINNWFHVALDGHQFQVVAADFVPIKPFYTNELILGVGQRYDVIIQANATVGNYWLNIGTGGAGQGARGCDGPNAAEGTVKAIFRYKGAPKTNPTGTGPVLTIGCEDEPHALSAIVKTNVPTGAINGDFDIGFIPANTSVQGQFVTWTVNDSAINIDWDTPTLKYVENKTKTGDYPKSDNVYEINVKPNAWTYWVVQQASTNPPIPHPIHLHGHDFWILSQGPGAWDGTFTSLTNPTRRDTATLPATGHLVLAFPADNPGAWLMHCHIPFHISGGLGLQFLERKKDILKTVSGLSGFDQGCAAWSTYQQANGPLTDEDSGLKM